MLSDLFGDGEALASRGACRFDQAEIGLDEPFEAPHPRPAMRVLGLVGEFVGRGDVLERPRPAAGQPLELAQHPQAHHLGAFVTAVLRRLRQVLEGCPGPFELASADEQPAVLEPWAFPVLQDRAEALFEFHASLEDARRDLTGVGLGEPDPGDRGRQQPRITDPFGELECRRGHRPAHRASPSPRF